MTVSRPRDSEQLRDVFITTRWTKDEAATIDKALRAGETRSQYLRRLVWQDSEGHEIIEVHDARGRVVGSFPVERPYIDGDTVVFPMTRLTISEN